MMTAIKCVMAAVTLAGLVALAPAEARGRHGHGFHGHHGFARAHVHCRTYRDSAGRRERVCV